MRILRLIAAVGEGFIRGLASGLAAAGSDFEETVSRAAAPTSATDGDVQLWDRVRAHNEWDQARIKAWRRRNHLALASGTHLRRDGDSLIAQLAAERPSPGGDAA